MLRLSISFPIQKKKKKKEKKEKEKKEAIILVKVYNILSNYIPIAFTYPFHYTFKGHELHTHFITIHLKGVSHSFHYIPISYPFKGHELHVKIITIYSLPISYLNNE